LRQEVSYDHRTSRIAGDRPESEGWHQRRLAGHLPTAYDNLSNALADPEQAFLETPLSMSVADALRQVPRAEIPDMPDRIVAATDLHFAAPLLSRDGRIRAANVKSIW
jgi:PIN domain nuclease of toxin-antitoxin system